MKYPFCIVLIALGLSPSTSQAQARIDSYWSSSIPTAKKYELKGHVKRITQVQSPITNKPSDWLDGYSGQNYLEEYNKQGFLQEHISCDDYNKPQMTTHYEYNAVGQIRAICEKNLALKPGRQLSEGCIGYEFDPVRNLYIIRDKRIIGGIPLNNRTEMHMDSVKRIAMKRKYEQDTLLIEEERYTWDAQRYMTELVRRTRKHLYKKPRLDQEEFDAFVNEIISKLPESEKKALRTTVAKSQAQTIYREDSLKHRDDSLYALQPEWTGDTTNYINQYDAQARLIRQEFYKHQRLTEVFSFSYTPEATRRVVQAYDRAGNLISETNSLQHPTEHYILSDTSRHKIEDIWESRTYYWTDYPKPVFSYQYDNHGNWIEQKQIDTNGKQVGPVLVRRVEYYP